MATNSIVTSSYLESNFVRKAGITYNNDNLIGLSCDQINTRCLLTISGTTITGTRLPSQNQLSYVIPTSLDTDFTKFYLANNTIVTVDNTYDIAITDIIKSYVGVPYANIYLVAFHGDTDADGRNFFTLKTWTGTTILSSDLPSPFGITTPMFKLQYRDTTDIMSRNGPDQMCSLEYKIIDQNGVYSATQYLYIRVYAAGNITYIGSATSITRTSATMMGSNYGSSLTGSGVFWNTSGIEGDMQFINDRGATYGGFTLNMTGLTPNTKYWYSPFSSANHDISITTVVLGASMRSFTTLP